MTVSLTCFRRFVSVRSPVPSRLFWIEAVHPSLVLIRCPSLNSVQGFDRALVQSYFDQGIFKYVTKDGSWCTVCQQDRLMNEE